jgi:pilus assembly protein CpaB
LTGGAGAQRVVLRALAPNEQILPTKVSGPGGRATLSAVLADGMRAVSLKSNEIAGVAGFVLPGDRVDVMLTRTVAGGETSVTQVLADNVPVLAVDQSNDEDTNKPAIAKAVTVQVTPEEAQVIALGQSVGTVSLALRSVADGGLPMRRATTLSDLGFNRPAAAPATAAPAAARVPPPPPPPPPNNVHVTRGTEVTGYRVSMR